MSWVASPEGEENLTQDNLSRSSRLGIEADVEDGSPVPQPSSFANQFSSAQDFEESLQGFEELFTEQDPAVSSAATTSTRAVAAPPGATRATDANAPATRQPRGELNAALRDIYARANDTLATLSSATSHTLCRFGLLNSFVEALEERTFSKDTKVFVCITHASSALKGAGCKYKLTTSNKAVKHARDMHAREATFVADVSLVKQLLIDTTVDTERLAELQELRRKCVTAIDHMQQLSSVVVSAGVGVMLVAFVDRLFYRVDTSDDRIAKLRELARRQPFHPDAAWMQCGAVFANCLKTRGGPWPDGMSHKANVIKQSRKQLIDSAFAVLRAVSDSAGVVSVHSRVYLRENVRLSKLLQASLPAANYGAFIGHMRLAAMAALPLDLTYAVFAERRHWYSDRHYRLLQAACALGMVDPDVHDLVGTLEEGLCGQGARIAAQSTTRVEEMCHAIEARMLEDMHQKRIVLPEYTRGMMNKRYEFMIALLPDLEAALQPFTTPLFWWPVASSGAVVQEYLHYIDMSKPSYKLQRCNALADFHRRF